MTEQQDKDIFVPRIPVVPDTWEVLPFAKAAKTASDRGKNIKKKDYLQEGTIPVIDQGQEFIGGYTDDDTMAYDGELPVILFGDHTRAFKYVDKPFAVGADGVKILKPSPDYDPKFFYYLLRSLQIPSRGYSRHFQFLKKFHLPLAPREQQKSIVAEIEKQFSRLDEAVANLKRVKTNLKRYKAAVLKAAVEGKLTEEWRKAHPEVEPASKLLDRILDERRAKWEEAELAKMEAKGKAPKNDKWKAKYKEPAVPDTCDLPELPEGWMWATAEQLTWLITSGSRGWGDYYSEEGVLFIRAQDIKTDNLNLRGVARVAIPAGTEGVRSSVSPQDILVTITGANVTKSALVPPLDEVAFVSQHVSLLKLTLPEIAPFIFDWVVSPANGRKALESWAYGAGKPGLSLEQVRSLPVALPPLSEQRRIVTEVDRHLSLIRETETQVNSNLQRTERLRQSILSRAFSSQMSTEAIEPMVAVRRES